MKKSQLKSIILEAVQEEMAVETYEPIDEIGKFMVVYKPKKGMTAEDIIAEMTIYDNIVKDDIIGVYSGNNKSTARKHAKNAIKEYEAQKEALKSQMEEFRNAKKAVEEKRKLAKETIGKLK